MSSSTTSFSIIKNEFTEVLTEGELTPTKKPTDWNIVFTENEVIDVDRTPTPPPALKHGLAGLYDQTFKSPEEYREFCVTHLVPWSNTLDFKHFDMMYMSHRSHTQTILALRNQAQSLLEEANKIQDRDYLIRHEIEDHVKRITRTELRSRLRKPQRIRRIVSPIPIPGPSQIPDNSHRATLRYPNPQRQYRCYQCDSPSHFKWDCKHYKCKTCNQTAPGHAPRNCPGPTYDDGLRGYFDLGGYDDGNLTGEC